MECQSFTKKRERERERISSDAAAVIQKKRLYKREQVGNVEYKGYGSFIRP